jgi:hypothetical protein
MKTIHLRDSVRGDLRGRLRLGRECKRRAERLEKAMNPPFACLAICACILTLAVARSAQSYIVETTIPETAGCPASDRWNASSAAPLQLQWSTSLPYPPAVITTAANGTPQQNSEIGTVIQASLGAWTGVASTAVNPSVTPGIVSAAGQTSVQDACTNDVGTNVDGVNTVCFNQSSDAFTLGVIGFTRVVTANAAGVSVGGGAPAAFAGQILDSDTLFNNSGQVTFATPSALATSPGSYDLESVLTHELGNYFGLDNSAVRRAIMYPFAPPPGTYIGNRPAASAPDGQLADDDRTGLRVLYPDPADTTYVGTIRGQIVPANPFALAIFPATSPGAPVTGIFGTQVVAENADTGAIVAAAMGGWSCNPSNPVPQFDGSYRIDKLPVGANYKVYVEPLDGLATSEDFYETSSGICSASGSVACTAPAVNTNFTTRVQPAAQ